MEESKFVGGDDEALAILRLLSGHEILVVTTDEVTVTDDDLPEAEELADGDSAG